jgi:hypothetical protein
VVGAADALDATLGGRGELLEEYATLGASVVVELNSESRTRRQTTRAWGSSAAPSAPIIARPTASTAATAGRPTAPAALTAPTEHARRSNRGR